MSNNETEFNDVMHEYLESSEKLSDAASLCGSDSIKQEMIFFIEPQFIEMCGRSEGIKLMVETSFVENKDFILSEMREVTRLNLKMVEQIKNKIGNLNTNDKLN